MSNQEIILHGSIPKMLWKLGAPNITALTVMTISTVADAYFVSTLGTFSLASLALVFPFQMLMIMMAGGAIGGGITSSVSRAIGSKLIEKAEDASWHGLLICFILSFIYFCIFHFFSKDIFSFMGASNQVLYGAIVYAKYFFGGSITIWLFYTLAAVIRGLGNTFIPSKAMIFGSVAQIFLSGLFTLGFIPHFHFGVAGPALATTICHLGMSIFLVSFFLKKHFEIQIIPKKFNLSIIIDIMKVGGLGLINSLTIAMTVAVVTGILGNIETKALAGYGLGARLELMLTPLIFGIGAALTTSVGMNIGSNKFARARKIAITGGVISFFIIGFLGLFFAIFPSLWLDNFSSDFQTIYYSKNYLKIVAPFYCFFGLGQALYFASQGTGKMIYPILVGLCRLFSVSLIGLITVYFDYSVNLVFWGVSLGLFITGFGMSLCLLSDDWRSSNHK